jgi:hypothetical protein
MNMSQNYLKTLFSVGAAIAASPVVRSIAHTQAFSDPLAIVGLERRSARVFERTALVAVGLLIGAGAALLMAPASGADTRRRIGEKVDGLAKDAKQLTDRANEYLHEAAEHAQQTTLNGLRSHSSSSASSAS